MDTDKIKMILDKIASMSGRVVSLHLTDSDGCVMWERDEPAGLCAQHDPARRYVTHRVNPRDGLLHSGSYDLTREEASRDFVAMRARLESWQRRAS